MKNKREYTFKEMSNYFGVSPNAIRVRADVLGIPKRFKDFRGAVKTRFVFYNEMEQIRNKTRMSTIINKPEFPEVIYVTRTTEIIHSKINFLELNQL